MKTREFNFRLFGRWIQIAIRDEDLGQTVSGAPIVAQVLSNGKVSSLHTRRLMLLTYKP